MTRFFAVSLVGIVAGATIFAGPLASRESNARISADLARFVAVSGRVTLLGADARSNRDVASAVVYLEPLTPPRPVAAAPPRPPVVDPAPRPVTPMPTATTRDTVSLLWSAVRELRQTVTDLREAIRQLRAQLAGEVVTPAPVTAEVTPPVADTAVRTPVRPNPPAAQPAAQPAPAPVRPRAIPSAAMAMRGKEFIPHVRIVEVGGAVEYPNRDPFSHNVFSNSPGGAFDLGLYPRGESRSAVFRRAGAYAIFCNIHAKMSAFVIAVPTQYFAQPTADGRFVINGVPPGRYRLRVWHERAPEQSSLVTVGDGGTADLAVTLDARSYRQTAHLNKFGQAYPIATRDDY